MPALTFLAAVGLALIALLFVADATLEPGPAPQYHNAIRTLMNTPAPGMTSQAARCATQVDARHHSEHFLRGTCYGPDALLSPRHAATEDNKE